MDLTGAGTGTLLVPLDGSRLAEAALPYALGLAGATGARVLLLHVAPDALLPLPKTLDLEATARAARRAAAGAPQGIAVETSVGCGDPALVIADVAAVRRVSLIVMTTHGRSGLGRRLYGSVAEGVLRRAPVPVLLVPGTYEQTWPDGRPRRILVPLDGSAYAEEALALAAQLGRATGAELRLLRVVELPLHHYGAGYVAVGFDPTSRLVGAREHLQTVAERLRAGGLEVTVRADAGEPGQVIGEHARVTGTDLVVMATHGHTGLARLALGSVAAATLQRANRPTVLVRPEAVRVAQALPEELVPDYPPPGPAVQVALSREELELIQRGLCRLLGEVHPAEPVAALGARLRAAADGISTSPSGPKPRREQEQESVR
jgi:nucleotide-binding universal stress UspA family protein